MRTLYREGTEIIAMIGRQAWNVDLVVVQDEEVEQFVADGWAYTPWEACGQNADETPLEQPKRTRRTKAEMEAAAQAEQAQEA